MIKNTNFQEEVQILSLSHDGRGVGTFSQKTTFVQGALPGEIATLKLLKRHKSYNEAEAVQIHLPSAERVSPVCKHFGLCGGCSLQHMSDSAQLSMKQQALLNQFEHFGNVIPQEWMPPLLAKNIGYRRKARLGVKYVFKKSELLVGFREKSSRYLANLELCETLHPAIGHKLHDLKNLIRSLNIFQHIPQIEVAMGDEEIALVFRHLQPLCNEDKAKLIAFGRTQGMHIYLQPNSPLPIEKIYPADNRNFLHYTLPDFSLTFLFHPLDFTQINLEMNRLMVNHALQLLDLKSDESALDLFCGIGNFSLALARLTKEVVGVEGSTAMVEKAQENARHNQLVNTHFYATDLFKPEAHAPWLKRTYDKILLDPPRAGAKEILPHLATLNPNRIVYISCNPATLARDAGELVHQHQFHLTKVGLINMFPHTAHTEAIALFEKK